MKNNGILGCIRSSITVRSRGLTLTIGEVTSGVLRPILGSPVQVRQGESPVINRVAKMNNRPEQLYCEERLRELGRQDGEEKDLTNVYEHLKRVGDRLFSVVPMPGQEAVGTKWNTRSTV